MDGLHSKAPQLRLLQELDFRYIIGAREADHAHLFAQLELRSETREAHAHDGTARKFRWSNGIELNKSNSYLEANLLEYWKCRPDRAVGKRGGKTRMEPVKTTHFSWIIDLAITPERLMPLMRAARAR